VIRARDKSFDVGYGSPARYASRRAAIASLATTRHDPLPAPDRAATGSVAVSRVSFPVTAASAGDRRQASRRRLRVRRGRGATAHRRGADAVRPRRHGGPAGRGPPPRARPRLGGVPRTADRRGPWSFRAPPPHRVPCPPGGRPRPTTGRRRRPVLRLGRGGRRAGLGSGPDRDVRVVIGTRSAVHCRTP
jgi:hypothetical protein